jgi:hypothetical protein
MVAEAAYSRPRTFRGLGIGAFGWREMPAATEVCPQGDCINGTTLVTDLYCTAHDRFLPYVRDWSNGARVAGAVVLAFLVYGSFALAAQLDSWVPLFLVYVATGLAIAVLPLRRFPVTAWVTAVLWLGGCAFAVSYRVAGSGARQFIVAVLILVVASGTGGHCATFAARDAKDERRFSNADRRPRPALAFVAGAFSLGLVIGITALALDYLPRTLIAAQSSLTIVMAIAAAACLAAGLIGATVAGAIDGVPRASRETPQIAAWQGAGKVTWRAHRTIIRPRHIRTVIDRMGDVLRRALIRLADAMRIVAVAAARTGLNLLFEAARIAVNWLIACTNAVIKFALITARMIAASIVSATWLATRAIALAIAALAYVALASVTPVAVIGVAASLAVVAAADTLRYLTDGSLAALLMLSVSSAIAMASLCIAWIVLASQRPALSFLSLRRSASIAGPYAVLFVAVGGWVVGLPGTFGPGRIHVGWITIVTTALLVVAFIWSQFSNSTQEESGGSSHPVEDSPERQSGYPV